jgi:ferredoxin/flavodoxin
LEIKKVLIAYFTGTGGTARAADAFAADLNSRNVQVKKHEIKTGRLIDNGDEDLLILLFAVHAANAPLPVYQWLENLKSVSAIPAVVISVSGGGEVFPNRGCRVSSIRRLEKKGYNVIYEQTVVMPSNVFVATPEDVAVKLLEVLPHKVQIINGDVLSGIPRRLKIRGRDRFLSYILEMEKHGTKAFGKKLFTDEKCNGCGWCEEKCPAGNIHISDGTPLFGKKCVMCFRCIYGCPKNAIQARSFRFALVNGGFDLKEIEKRVSEKSVKTIDEIPKTLVWKGVRKYFKQDDPKA